ncbi:MAG: nucleotidyl transferase AbiEii/AbiGii toxin family protein [Aridibacter famidurans]|nr:nucleotidyl transferase AbiEii/AbiGii toxin family protein [Aridibacter famidurans]
MDRIANLSAAERRDLFQATSGRTGIHAAIIEKDFWVCWALGRIFADEALRDDVVFKGGTSLSKAYSAIDRFSEDIDLVVNWELIGYGARGLDPWEDLPSRSKLNRFLEEFGERAEGFVKGEFCEQVKEAFAICPGVIVRAADSEVQVIDVTYPAAFALEALRPAIKLEIGPLASWVPSSKRSISSYSAIEFPELFTSGNCEVVVTDAERTFWEKATILHEVAHREKSVPRNYSRHYYDVFKLCRGPIKESALSDLDLLREVVRFKERFYPSNRARYDLAKPGSFRLIPNEEVSRELENDYSAMREMIFGPVPGWDEIMAELKSLEIGINEK